VVYCRPNTVLEPAAGFEPATPCLQDRRSNHLSYTGRVITDITASMTLDKLEPATGIEPASPAWKAGTLAIELHRQRVPGRIRTGVSGFADQCLKPLGYRDNRTHL